MIRRLPLFALVFLSAAACGDDDTSSAPDGLTCGSTATAQDEASLRSGAGAGAGTCVVVSGDITVTQAIVVKPGVVITAAKNTRAKISGTATGEGLIVLGEGSGLQGIDVVGA